MAQFMIFAICLTGVLLFTGGRAEAILAKRKYFIAFFILLILGGVGLRLMYVNQMPYTNDEGFYLYDARTVLQGRLPGGDAIAKAPVFVGAAAALMALAGNILTAGRWVSLLSGILTAWPLYVLGKRIGGKRIGIATAALWLLSSMVALFNSYGHTQSIQILFGASALALLVLAQKRKHWFVFFMAGVALGVSIVARKSSLALGLPVMFILLTDKTSWKIRFLNLIWLGGGLLVALGIFFAGIFKFYGMTGVLYATGLSLAKESIDQLADRSDLYATYSVNGILPFFREGTVLIFLGLTMIGHLLERYARRFNGLLARFAWIVPLWLAVVSVGFIGDHENKIRLTYGVGWFWSIVGFLLVFLAVFPLKRNDFKNDKDKMVWLPLVWFAAVGIFYAFWIKFSANYLVEFLPALTIVAALGAIWLFDNLRGHKFATLTLALLLIFANYGAAQNAFKFEHTGTFHWSAILEAADYLKKNVPPQELVETAAMAVPYVSGHHVPYDVAHPTWYAYGFIEPELRDVFMVPSDKIVDAVLNRVNWFVRDKITEFSYFREYPMIEKDINENFVQVHEIENYSNPIRIYKRNLKQK